MIDENPYASPRGLEGWSREPLEFATSAPADPVGLWRDGGLIVAHRQSQWPLICPLCNESAVNTVRIVLEGSEPGQFRVQLFSLLIGLDAYHYGLYERCRRNGDLLMLLGIGLVAVGLFGFCLSIVPAVILVPLGAVLLPWAVHIHRKGEPDLHVEHLLGDYAWIRGAQAGFVDRLPPWKDPIK
jgi:hypothetical protein